ncbi:hypothetical protein HKX48_004506 [Thoreauomyces humboldtii]|nr:hypothetical protein HKX48_004506 [Thoreauomyces humboldtii]
MAEMTEPNARYIVAVDGESVSDAPPVQKSIVGFLYFQFTMEDCNDEEQSEVSNIEDEHGESDVGSGVTEIPVVYCYELQLEAGFQRRGVGSHLMSILERVGALYGMRKALLTSTPFTTKGGQDILRDTK